MTRPRVLLDCDGILSNFAEAWLAVVNRELGRSHVIDEIDRWNIGEALGLSKEQEEICYAVSSRPGWCAALEVYDGAQAGVKALEAIADVYIVTSPLRSDTWHREREQWLWRHFKIPTKRIMHGSAKYICVGDFFVDDRTANCDRWKESHPNAITVRWNTLHNVTDSWSGVSTSSWDRLCEMVRNGHV